MLSPGTLGVEPTPAQDYLTRLADAAEEAGAAAGGWARHDLELGGSAVRLRFAGEALVPVLLPPLAHLASSRAGAPDLEFTIWDSASTGVALPRLPWAIEDVVDRGLVRGYNDERVRTLYHLGFGGLTMLDVESGKVVFWVSDGRKIEWHDRAAPMRSGLNWALAGPRRRLVHAAAIGRDEGGVLLAGRAGAGKTTLALAAVAAGLGYVGDDYVLLSTEGEPRAHSVYSTAKVRPESIEVMPELAGFMRAATVDGEKAVIDVHRYRPGSVLRSVRLRAVLLPRIGFDRIRLERTSPAAALRALAPSTVFQLPHNAADGAAHVRNLAALVKEVPVYAMELTGDLTAAAEVVAELVGGT